MSEEFIEVEEEPVPPNNNWTEQRRVRGRDLVDSVKKIAKEANVRRITVRRPNGTTLVDIPMGLGIAGMIILPSVLVVLTVGVGILKEYSLVIERQKTADDPDALVIDVEAAIEKARSKAQQATEAVRERAGTVAAKASEKTADIANRIDAKPADPTTEVVEETVAIVEEDETIVEDLIAKYAPEGDMSDLERLEAVNGVGPALAKKLLAEFKTADAIKAAKAKDIAVIRGVSEALAKVIKKTL